MDFEGKATCYSATKRQNWSNISFLGWPSLWSLGNTNATLAFYMLPIMGYGKTTFVSEKEWNKTIVKMKKVINPQICETLLKLKFLKNVVKRDRVKTLLKDFSMAGKTGTAQVDYGKDGGSGQYYASSL
jgi:cell division protein FtsI (penicillin-binding protein 3)